MAIDVRILLQVEDAARQVSVLDRDDWPEEPRRSWDRLFPLRRIERPVRNIEVKKTSVGWTIEATISKVRPKEDVRLPDQLGFGALKSMTIQITGRIFAENLPEPLSVGLEIVCHAFKREAPLEELESLASERFLASPTGRSVLALAEKMHGPEPPEDT